MALPLVTASTVCLCRFAILSVPPLLRARLFFHPGRAAQQEAQGPRDGAEGGPEQGHAAAGGHGRGRVR